MNSVKVVQVLFVGAFLFATCWADSQRKFEWKQIDFNYEKDTDRQEDVKNLKFISENVIPVGFDIHENRLFLTLPRLKFGVPASLAYINLTDSKDSPKLNPYPSWQQHRAINAGDVPDIVSSFHIKIDRCNRLWAVDTGFDGQLNESNAKRLAPARILIFDLRTDNLIRKINITYAGLDHDMEFKDSIFSNIVVDVDEKDCDNAFAYIADAGTSFLNVYSFKADETWTLKHNYFNIDPSSGNFTVMGVEYHNKEALYGLTLSEKKANGYPDLYFHPLTSTYEFKVSTKILRDNKVDSGKIYHDFMKVGSRGIDGQAGVTVYDEMNKIFFYTMPNLNEIACWKTSTKDYNISKIDKIQTAYPIDIKIDSNGNIWTLSNNMQQFLKAKVNSVPNFYIDSIPMKEAIKNTPCETGIIEHLLNHIDKIKGGSSDAFTIKPVAFLITIVSIMLSLRQLF